MFLLKFNLKILWYYENACSRDAKCCHQSGRSVGRYHAAARAVGTAQKMKCLSNCSAKVVLLQTNIPKT